MRIYQHIRYTDSEDLRGRIDSKDLWVRYTDSEDLWMKYTDSEDLWNEVQSED